MQVSLSRSLAAQNLKVIKSDEDLIGSIPKAYLRMT